MQKIENLNPLSIPGVYKFINIKNNKVYIGSSENIRRRMFKHLNLLNSNKHHSRHFQNSWNKHGKDSFTFEVIEYCDIDDLLIREQYYLDTVIKAQDYINNENNLFLKLSYNINPCASNRLGTTQSEESIQKSKENNPNRIEVVKIKFNGELLKEYFSISDAALDNNCSKTQISKCCKGTQQYCGDSFYCIKEHYYNNINGIKDYFDSLHANVFVPKVWNKGKSIKTTTSLDKKALLYTIYGEYVGEFSTNRLAAEYISCTYANLTKAKKAGKPVKGYYVFDEESDHINIMNNIKNNMKIYFTPHYGTKFKMYDLFDNEISSWNNIRECESITGLKYNSIMLVLKKERKQLKGFKFKYIEDIV